MSLGPWVETTADGQRVLKRRVRSRCSEVVLQSVEPVVPGVGEGGEKLLGELNGCGPQPVTHAPALARLGRDEARFGQEREVALPKGRQLSRIHSHADPLVTVRDLEATLALMRT